MIEEGQQIYGQHYFCVTTSVQEMNNIASAYQVDYVHVYSSNLPASLNTAYPNFQKMA